MLSFLKFPLQTPRVMRPNFLAIAAVLAFLGNAPAAEQPKPSAQAVEFFEAKVRPLLAEHCYSCHGAKKQNAGLRLDSATGMKQGSDSGPVLIPGDPVKSRLLKAVRREGDAPMPPNKPLPPEAVIVLTEWVKTGAVFPDDQALKPVGPDARKHWAYQPVKDVTPPAVKGAAVNAVDRFLLAKLEGQGLSFAAPADRRTLLAAFDRFRREADASGLMDGLDGFNQQAFGMLTSSRLLEALNVEKESAALRERYGKGDAKVHGDAAPMLNEQFLVARRLVEAGARFVTVAYGLDRKSTRLNSSHRT